MWAPLLFRGRACLWMENVLISMRGHSNNSRGSCVFVLMEEATYFRILVGGVADEHRRSVAASRVRAGTRRALVPPPPYACFGFHLPPLPLCTTPHGTALEGEASDCGHAAVADAVSVATAHPPAFCLSRLLLLLLSLRYLKYLLRLGCRWKTVAVVGEGEGAAETPPRNAPPRTVPCSTSGKQPTPAASGGRGALHAKRYLVCSLLFIRAGMYDGLDAGVDACLERRTWCCFLVWEEPFQRGFGQSVRSIQVPPIVLFFCLRRCRQQYKDTTVPHVFRSLISCVVGFDFTHEVLLLTRCV